MQARTRPGISSSRSGCSTTNGYSTRQSVASVTCDTRAKPSKRMLSSRVWRARTRRAFLRRSQVARNSSSNSCTAWLRGGEQLADLGVALGVLGLAPLLDLAEAVMQRLDQRGAALRVVEQVVLQVRVAPDDPDVAQHLVQHPRAAAGAALAAQFVEHAPGVRAQQPDHDLAIGERRVVVRNLPQASGRFEDRRLGLERLRRRGSVHEGLDRACGPRQRLRTDCIFCSAAKP